MSAQNRFIHEDGQRGQRVVPTSFESDKDDAVKNFSSLHIYWDTQIAKGGEAARVAKAEKVLLSRRQASACHEPSLGSPRTPPRSSSPLLFADALPLLFPATLPRLLWPLVP